jgi:hypothetical protein
MGKDGRKKDGFKAQAMVFQGTNRRGCSSVQRMQPVWAAVFDWDGVILDSSRHHEES